RRTEARPRPAPRPTGRSKSGSSGGSGRRGHRFGPEVGRGHDLDQLEVLRMGELPMPDAGRLVHAGAGFHQHLADALVLEAGPAAQHVDELQADLVAMPLAGRVGAFAGTDHVHDRMAVGGIADAEVTVLEILPQPVGVELAVARVLDAEFHGELLRWISSRTGMRWVRKRAGFSIIGKWPSPGIMVAVAPGMRAAVAALFSARHE